MNNNRVSEVAMKVVAIIIFAILFTGLIVSLLLPLFDDKI